MRVGAGLVGAVAAGVLIGWAAGLQWATQLSAGLPAMMPNTALGLLLLAAGWFVPRPVALVAAGATAAIASLTLVEHVAGLDLRIDEALFADPGGSAHGGRMAAGTALSLLALAACRVLLSVRLAARRVVEATSLAVLAVGSLAAMGYLYGVTALYRAGALTIGLHTAVSLCVLAVASFASVRGGFAEWVYLGDDAGARLLRSVLPVALVLTPLVAYVPLYGPRAGLYGIQLGLALMAVCLVAMLTGTSLYTARVLARLDRGRDEALEAVRIANQSLESLAWERAEQLEAVRSDGAVLRERQRIAADMHDLVIQRLFSVSLGLEVAAMQDPDPADIETAIHGVNGAINELRSSIMSLKRAPDASSVTDTLNSIARAAAAALGSPPRVTVTGPADDLPEAVSAHLVAVAREAVSNAVRHARASTISVDLHVTESNVLLAVADDGIGLDPETPSTSGLANIRTRAAALGGTCAWRRNLPGTGTRLTWQMPLVGAAAVRRGPRHAR